MSPLAFLKQPIRLLQGDQRLPRNHHRRTEFRLRPDRTPGDSGATRRPRPVHLGGRAQRRRAGSPPHHRADHELLAPAGFAPSAMRPGYGMAEVTLMATVEPRRPALPRRRRRRPRTEPLHTGHGPRDQPGELRRAGTRRRGADRRPRNPARAGRRPGRRDLAAQRERRQRLPQPSRGDDRTVSTPTPPTASGPYLRTGDLGLLHEDELYVTGRLKDLLIVNGRNLYPQDIEEFVQDVHPAVAGSRGCRDLGRRRRRRTPGLDPGRQDRVARRHELRRARRRRQERRRACLRGPRPGVVFVNRAGIHLTTSGKVQRASMRAAFLNGELTDVVHEEHLT